MMQRIDLNWASRRRSAWTGRILLALALAVCLDAGLAYTGLAASLADGEARLAKRTGAARAPKATPQELAAARETVQRLALPWDDLFRALEAAASDQVVLASIEPDTAKGIVTISGDGKDYLAALTYVANLSRTEGLDAVQLVRHEQKAQDPRGRVSFAVTAAWSGK